MKDAGRGFPTPLVGGRRARPLTAACGIAANYGQGPALAAIVSSVVFFRTKDQQTQNKKRRPDSRRRPLLSNSFCQYWGCSSHGRALRSHRRGSGIDTRHLQHSIWLDSVKKEKLSCLFVIIWQSNQRHKRMRTVRFTVQQRADWSSETLKCSLLWQIH